MSKIKSLFSKVLPTPAATFHKKIEEQNRMIAQLQKTVGKLNEAKKEIKQPISSLALHEQIKTIFDSLQDDESRQIFLRRQNYYLSRKKEYLHDMVRTSHTFNLKNYDPLGRKPFPLEYFMFDKSKKRVVLYGRHRVEDRKKFFKFWDVSFCCICPNELGHTEKSIYGLTVVSPEELAESYKDCDVVVSVASEIWDEIYQKEQEEKENEATAELIKLGFPREQIYIFPRSKPRCNISGGGVLQSTVFTAGF